MKLKRETGTYSVGLEFVVNLVIGFTIIELGHVHSTDKRAICQVQMIKNQPIIRGRKKPTVRQYKDATPTQVSLSWSRLVEYDQPVSNNFHLSCPYHQFRHPSLHRQCFLR